MPYGKKLGSTSVLDGMASHGGLEGINLGILGGIISP